MFLFSSVFVHRFERTKVSAFRRAPCILLLLSPLYIIPLFVVTYICYDGINQSLFTDLFGLDKCWSMTYLSQRTVFIFAVGNGVVGFIMPFRVVLSRVHLSSHRTFFRLHNTSTISKYSAIPVPDSL